MPVRSEQQFNAAHAACTDASQPWPAVAMQQAMSAYLLARGQSDAWVWTANPDDLRYAVDHAASFTTPGPEKFASVMWGKRFMAYNQDCTLNQNVWKCLLAWHAKPENQAYWLKPAQMYAPAWMPDDAYAGCAPQAPAWPGGAIDLSQIVLPPGIVSPVPVNPGRIPWNGDQGSQAGGQDQGGGGQGEQPPATATPSGLKWVGVVAVAGLAGLGIWYATRTTEPKPAPKRVSVTRRSGAHRRAR